MNNLPGLPDQSLPGLIAWLKTQDPATTFTALSAGDCLWTRYGQSQGPQFHNFRAASILLDDQARVAFGEINIKGGSDGSYGYALALAEGLVANG